MTSHLYVKPHILQSCTSVGLGPDRAHTDHQQIAKVEHIIFKVLYHHLFFNLNFKKLKQKENFLDI